MQHSPKRSNHGDLALALLRCALIRLVTPSGGIVLDPFAGSGTTGVAALDEACNAILIEREPEYAAIANARLAQAESPATIAHAAAALGLAPAPFGAIPVLVLPTPAAGGTP